MRWCTLVAGGVYPFEWVMSHMNESCHTWMSHVTHEWVMLHIDESCHIWMSHVTHEWVMSHMNESCHFWICMTIWMGGVLYKWTVCSGVAAICRARVHAMDWRVTLMDEVCDTRVWVRSHVYIFLDCSLHIYLLSRASRLRAQRSVIFDVIHWVLRVWFSNDKSAQPLRIL